MAAKVAQGTPGMFPRPRGTSALVLLVLLLRCGRVVSAFASSIRTGCQIICSSTNRHCRPRESVAVAEGKMHTAALSQASLYPETVREKPYSFRRPVRCIL